MLDPWSLMYGEYEEEFIEVLRQRIGPKHPLYNREVYAIAIRRDPEATLFHTFNDGFYAIVYFSGVPKGRRGMPETEIFAGQQAVGEKIAVDHGEQLEQEKAERAVSSASAGPSSRCGLRQAVGEDVARVKGVAEKCLSDVFDAIGTQNIEGNGAQAG